jgi:hypothetical protein
MWLKSPKDKSKANLIINEVNYNRLLSIDDVSIIAWTVDIGGAVIDSSKII